MFKKDFGISVYPEKSDWKTIEQYLIKARKAGFTRLFLSWLQLRDDAQKYLPLYKKTIQKAKELGYYVVLDINDNKFAFYQETLKVDCVRMDAPSLPHEVANYTHQTDLDFQLNMSGLGHYLENVLDCDPVVENLSGCHNFFPQLNTGLGWEFFKACNQRYNDKAIHTSAFINSLTGVDGPQKFKLKYGVVTVEDMRFFPIRSQAKYLLACKQIDAIYIGNQFASDEELASFSDIDRKKIELDIEIVPEKLQPLEKDILLADQYRRGDINESFIRMSEHRLNFADREDIEVRPGEHHFKRGDVVITNNSDPNYQKELQLLISDRVLENAQIVGRVKEYDLGLMDFIHPSTRFKFRIV